MFNAFRKALARARPHGDMYFSALVDQETFSAAFGEASSLWQGWIYTPAVTSRCEFRCLRTKKGTCVFSRRA